MLACIMSCMLVAMPWPTRIKRQQRAKRTMLCSSSMVATASAAAAACASPGVRPLETAASAAAEAKPSGS